MGVGAGLYMCGVVKKFTFAISSPDEFLFVFILCCSTFVLIGECVLLLCLILFFHAKPRDWLGECLRNNLFCVEWNVKS